MGKDDENFNPDKERPGYGISHPNYAPVHRRSDPAGMYEKQKRSDEQISNEIGKRLAEIPTLDVTRIRIEVASGDVTINGTVRSAAELALVEEIVCGTPEVSACENNLRTRD